MSQDEELHQQYVPLAMHLADEYFLNHPSKDVRLFIACCIADVLRVYAPDAPYKDSDQVKRTIFIVYSDKISKDFYNICKNLIIISLFADENYFPVSHKAISWFEELARSCIQEALLLA